MPSKKPKLLISKKTPSEKSEAQVWLDKIRRAGKVKDRWRDLFRVSLGYDYWEGRQRPTNVPESEWVTINLIYSNLISMLPGLYQADPYFYVKLKRSYRPEPMLIVLYEQRAKIRQAMLNYLKEELQMKPKTRLSIFDACFQFGVAKIYHAAELVDNPDAGKPLEDENGAIMMSDTGEAIKEPEVLPAGEAYKITRIHPDDFLVDEDAGPLDEDVKWKAHRIKKNISEVRKDKRFEAAARKGVKPTEVSEGLQKEREQRKKGSVYDSQGENKEADTVVMWEVYDLRNEQILCVSEGYNEWMIKPSPLPKGIERDPFVDLRFTLRDDSWYPIPPISQWLDPQKDYCTLRSKISTHRKRFNRKYAVFAGGLESEAELTKLEIGEDGTVIKTNQPVQTVYPIADAALDQTHFQELSLLREELTMLSVVSQNQRRSGSGVESATEAGIIDVRLKVQEGDWIGLVVDFILHMARKLDQQVQANINRDEAIKVSGPQGEYWELVRVDDYQEIEGEYEYSINVASMMPQLPEIERAQFTAMLNLLISAPQLILSKRLMQKIAEMFHIEDEAMVQELMAIAQKMMSGALPMPGQQGSTPGTPGLPGTDVMGMAKGMANMRGGQ